MYQGKKNEGEIHALQLLNDKWFMIENYANNSSNRLSYFQMKICETNLK